MRSIKMFGLVVAAACAFMALYAGSASATTLCATPTTPCNAPYLNGTHLTMSLSGSDELETTGGVILDTCSGAEITQKMQNTTGTSILKKILGWFFSGCTRTTTTLSLGEIETSHISGTDNGTMVMRGTEWTINGIFGTSCVYGGGAGTTLGTLVGGNPATLAVSALVPRTVSNFLCPSEVRMTESWVLTAPHPVYVEP